MDDKEKLAKLMSLIDDAIKVIKKNIDKFENNPEYEQTVKDLKHGLGVLERGKKFRENNIKLFKEEMKTPREKRGGFGLSRGFGEFLLAIQEDWVHEILDAVYKIEHYYRHM